MAVTPIKIGIRPPRIYWNMQVLHAIRFPIGVGPGLMGPRPNVAVPAGTIPAGSFIRGAAYAVRTIFAPAVTLNVGTSATALDNLVAAGSLAATGYFPSADALAGLGYSADERIIYVSLTGAQITAGAGDVIVLFYPYKD